MPFRHIFIGGSIHTIKKNTEALVVTSKETGLEVNVVKTKYMGMSLDQNARRSHNIMMDNQALERDGKVPTFGNKPNE